MFVLVYNQNICFGYSKNQSQWDFTPEHSKQMFKLVDKKILKIQILKILFIWTVFLETLPWSNIHFLVLFLSHEFCNP